jgi:hypothetical protein
MAFEFMCVQASAESFVCFNDLIGNATIRTKGVDHECGVETGHSGTKDPDGEVLLPWWTFRGLVLVKNSFDVDIRRRLLGVVEPRVDSRRYIYPGELGCAQVSG